MIGSPEYVLGIDEVGYGAIAGPMVVAMVAVPLNWALEGLRDSKRLSPRKREALAPSLKDFVVTEGWLSAAEVDELGGYKGLIYLTQRVIAEGVASFPGCPVIVDGSIQYEGAISIPKADDRVPAVMAASVHAKVFRDHLMEDLHHNYTEYNFASNKGYGSEEHYTALRKKGPCPEHRKSYLKTKNGAVVAPRNMLPASERTWKKWPTLKDVWNRSK